MDILNQEQQKELAETVNDETDFQLYCDVCFTPSLKPEHAHYKCSNCGARTSCCEGA